MLEGLVKFFTSLRLTATLLGLGAVLVFFGTLAQESLGLYDVQARFFQSFFVDANAFYAGVHKLFDMLGQGFGYPLAPLDAQTLKAHSRLPLFPGGYLLGGLLLINLFSAHLRYYQPGKKKWGIVMIHLGIVLLLLGQLLTDRLSHESFMHIREGASKNYSEAPRDFELAVIDTTDAEADKVVAIPGGRLGKRGDITHPELPVTIKVKTLYSHSALSEEARQGYAPVNTTAGFGAKIWWRELPHVTVMEDKDIPSGIVELLTPQATLGTFLVSGFLTRPQEFEHNGRSYRMELRPTRSYKPFSLRLLEFRFDRYPGTDTPKNYSSRVRVQRPDTGEDREVLIKMNSPLRYAGETFYQASFDKDDEKGTVLQVVHNPSWLTPYFSCVLVAAGMIYQFLSHLIAFATKRKTV